jgi:hypothetical protein
MIKPVAWVLKPDPTPSSDVTLGNLSQSPQPAGGTTEVPTPQRFC